MEASRKPCQLTRWIQPREREDRRTTRVAGHDLDQKRRIVCALGDRSDGRSGGDETDRSGQVDQSRPTFITYGYSSACGLQTVKLKESRCVRRFHRVQPLWHPAIVVISLGFAFENGRNEAHCNASRRTDTP